jgi:hypothetical protein
MKLKLNRLSNLFRASFWRNCLILGSIFFLIPLLLLLVLDAFVLPFVLAVVGVNLIGFFSLLMGYPGRAELYGGELSYSENYEISVGERRRLYFRISNISQVEFLQNRLEQKLDIGRIRFRGTAEVEPADALKGRELVSFELCGIKQFDAFMEALKKELK